MNNILLAEGQQGAGGIITMILLYAVMFGALYFILFRPQSKKRKKEEKMR